MVQIYFPTGIIETIEKGICGVDRGCKADKISDQFTAWDRIRAAGERSGTNHPGTDAEACL